MGRLIELLGAESTGKTTLAANLGQALRSMGQDAHWVGEHLRQWVNQHGRTPLVHEQVAVAKQQSLALQEAMKRHDWVIADTSAWMTAVYSEAYFGDESLYALAADPKQTPMADAIMVMGLDLPWVADGTQRDGIQVQTLSDAILRRSLTQHGRPFSVIYGQDEARLAHALAHCTALGSLPAHSAQEGSKRRWRTACLDCGLTSTCPHQMA